MQKQLLQLQILCALFCSLPATAMDRHKKNMLGFTVGTMQSKEFVKKYNNREKRVKSVPVKPNKTITIPKRTISTPKARKKDPNSQYYKQLEPLQEALNCDYFNLRSILRNQKTYPKKYQELIFALKFYTKDQNIVDILTQNYYNDCNNSDSLSKRYTLENEFIKRVNKLKFIKKLKEIAEGVIIQ